MDITRALEKCKAALTTPEREELKTELSGHLNRLLLTDFPALVQILYRVDVPEQKLKRLLKENPKADAGDLLAELLIQRQQQKAATRKSSQYSDAEPGEERW